MQPIEVGSTLKYDVTAPTVFLLNVSLAETPYQQILNERMTVQPDVEVQACQVGLGKNRFHRISVEPGELVVHYRARAKLLHVTEDAPEIDQVDYAKLPADVLTYLNPSRYCESDKLANFAFAEFGNEPANFARVDHICDWINDHLTYQSGTTTSTTTACDVLIGRQGVCRDFRPLGDYVLSRTGCSCSICFRVRTAIEPPDFHGFFEAYLGDRWYLFDPTRLAPAAGLLRIGTGRDAADVAFSTIWGAATLQEKEVFAKVNEAGSALLDEDGSEVAVSTA